MTTGLAELLSLWEAGVRSMRETARSLRDDSSEARELRNVADYMDSRINELRGVLHLSEQQPVELLLWCPQCNERHIDVGEFATRPHKTHTCQVCGMHWQPALVPTKGVQFLPGCKNPVASS